MSDDIAYIPSKGAKHGDVRVIDSTSTTGVKSAAALFKPFLGYVRLLIHCDD